MEDRMATRNCAAAGVFATEKDYHGKRSWTARLRLRAGLALTLTLLLCFTNSTRALATQQKASEGSTQEQNSVSKEVDQLRKEVGELREDLKRLHALLGPRPAGSESASAPAGRSRATGSCTHGRCCTSRETGSWRDRCATVHRKVRRPPSGYCNKGSRRRPVRSGKSFTHGPGDRWRLRRFPVSNAIAIRARGWRRNVDVSEHALCPRHRSGAVAKAEHCVQHRDRI